MIQATFLRSSSGNAGVKLLLPEPILKNSSAFWGTVKQQQAL
jgi:hypothetical protein